MALSLCLEDCNCFGTKLLDYILMWPFDIVWIQQNGRAVCMCGGDSGGYLYDWVVPARMDRCVTLKSMVNIANSQLLKNH